MASKTLFLEKRGCDFFAGDPVNIVSDVTNYRVGVYDYSIKGKNGRDYTLEFTRYDRCDIRTANKRTGAPLKKPVRELVLKNALCIDTSFYDGGLCYCDIRIERKLLDKMYLYTLEDILRAVNEISADTYTDIEFI